MSKSATATAAKAYPVRRVAGRKGGAGEFLALASDGQSFYSLQVDNHLRVACDPRCAGFRFRRDCRHAQDVSAALIREIEANGHVAVRDERPSAPALLRPRTGDPLAVAAIEDEAWTEAYV